MVAPVISSHRAGEKDVVAVVQVANKVRAQVKTFTREDEQAWPYTRPLFIST